MSRPTTNPILPFGKYDQESSGRREVLFGCFEGGRELLGDLVPVEDLVSEQDDLPTPRQGAEFENQAEILVGGQEDAAFLVCSIENLLIRESSKPEVMDCLDIVACGAKGLGKR